MPTKTISKSKFKPKALEHFRKIQETGQALVITEHGKPVLKIVPYVEDPEAALRALRGTVVAYRDPLEPVGEDDWEAMR
jgi:antitoxin (DNA-binding transcriptional repressor) of toxin-antitoxin stability system